MVVKTIPDFHAYGRSDRGLVRCRNEDAWAQLPQHNFFVLADGMGGHQSGDVAAKTAVEQACELVADFLDSRVERQRGEDGELAVLRYAIKEVNRRVYNLGLSDDGLLGMGTTLLCLYFSQAKLVLGHVGDSRVYRWRDDALEQLTQDHSLVQQLIQGGDLEESKVSDFSKKNVLTRAVGVDSIVEPEITTHSVEEGDVYLMCSDGLSDMLGEDDIRHCLLQQDSVRGWVNMLIDEAKRRGGRDNITAVMIEVTGCGE